MKKKYWLYVLFVGLLAIAAFTLLNRKSGTFKSNESQFAVRDTASINIIEIKSQKNTVILERTGEQWKINDKFSADNKKITKLLMAISRLKVSAPVAAEIRDEVKKTLTEQGKKVMVIGSRKSQHLILMYQDTIHAQATYMMLGGSDQPFKVEIPGYLGINLAGLFVDEEGYWRDNSIFKLRENEIISITRYNSSQPEKSFYLVAAGNSKYKLFTYSDSMEITDPDPEQVRQYLSYFATVSFERFISDIEKNDQPEWRLDKPEDIITVKDSRNNLTKVETFPWFAPGQKEQSKPDVDRLIVVINETDTVIAKYIDLDPIIKDIGYFLEKEENNLYN